ncbi:uncharacterized protein P884DRAFT_293020 [Thermothelomyces heterothallicus CBS 202.75]|uniref:uncharacterized protein n=1 Tax=Thermothelomyces heterothallicus CBS 202.75 TaxID=1149848 RepID=UPI0037437F94
MRTSFHLLNSTNYGVQRLPLEVLFASPSPAGYSGFAKDGPQSEIPAPDDEGGWPVPRYREPGSIVEPKTVGPAETPWFAREPDIYEPLVARCGSPSASVHGGHIAFFGRSSPSPLARIRAGNISSLNGPGRWLQRGGFQAMWREIASSFIIFAASAQHHVVGAINGPREREFAA